MPLITSNSMNLLDSIAASRKLATESMRQTLSILPGSTEIEFKDALLANLRSHKEFYPSGWYAPPPDGVCVLFDNQPFTRLQFDTIRDEKYWPGDSRFSSESVGIVYCSPVNMKTSMIGDTGLTLYTGENLEIQAHIRNCYDAMLAAADLAQVGMRFNDLYTLAMKTFVDHGLTIGWMTTEHDATKGVNLGHTIPGSYGEPLPSGDFEETKEAIRSRRIYINPVELFEIPETCAFTFESRLTDMSLTQPNVFFHMVVSFSGGERKTITGFDGIFGDIGMKYML